MNSSPELLKTPYKVHTLKTDGAGVCVLTSDVQENRQVVDDAGFTFRRGNVDDVEQMLRLLMEILNSAKWRPKPDRNEYQNVILGTELRSRLTGLSEDYALRTASPIVRL